MNGVSTTIRDVQAILLSLFNDKTILIGHSLESDLIALKVSHAHTPTRPHPDWSQSVESDLIVLKVSHAHTPTHTHPDWSVWRET